MSQRFAVDQALQLFQSIALESSYGEYSDTTSYELNNVIADIQNEEDSSDSDDEYTNQEAPINTNDGAHFRSSSDNNEQILLSKDRSHWRCSVSSQVTARRLQQHNIVRIRAGPKSYFTSSIIRGSPHLFQRVHAKEYSEGITSEAHRVIGNNTWTVTLDEQDKLMGLMWHVA